MSSGTRFNLLVASMAVLAVAACSSGKATDSSTAESEQLLKAPGGPWSLVEDKKSGDPMKDNIAARQQVDPSPHASSEGYTSKPAPGDLNEPMHFRVLKLEHQMAGLQQDFDKLLPPLKTLAANDDQLDQTLAEIKAHQEEVAHQHMAEYGQLPPPGPSSAEMPAEGLKVAPPPESSSPEALEAERQQAQVAGPMPETVEPAVAAPPAAPPPPQAPPQAMQGGVNVTGVRIGEHPGKVRIVLDLSGPAKFTADLDNDEKLLLIDLPGTGWGTDAQKTLKSPLLTGYSAQPAANGAGTTLAIQLAGPAKLLSSAALTPNGSYGQRIVLDVAAQ